MHILLEKSKRMRIPISFPKIFIKMLQKIPINTWISEFDVTTLFGKQVGNVETIRSFRCVTYIIRPQFCARIFSPSICPGFSDEIFSAILIWLSCALHISSTILSNKWCVDRGICSPRPWTMSATALISAVSMSRSCCSFNFWMFLIFLGRNTWFTTYSNMSPWMEYFVRLACGGSKSMSVSAGRLTRWISMASILSIMSTLKLWSFRWWKNKRRKGVRINKSNGLCNGMAFVGFENQARTH